MIKCSIKYKEFQFSLDTMQTPDKYKWTVKWIRKYSLEAEDVVVPSEKPVVYLSSSKIKQSRIKSGVILESGISALGSKGKHLY